MTYPQSTPPAHPLPCILFNGQTNKFYIMTTPLSKNFSSQNNKQKKKHSVAFSVNKWVSRRQLGHRATMVNVFVYGNLALFQICCLKQRDTFRDKRIAIFSLSMYRNIALNMFLTRLYLHACPQVIYNLLTRQHLN